MAKLEFTKWPFDEREIVTLHWLRSPFMYGENKQWYLTALFRRENNKVVGLDLPWGILPLLKIGGQYVDGKACNNYTGYSLCFDLSTKVTVDINKAADVIPDSLYSLYNNKDYNERCVVIRDNDMTVIVPCLEVIRSFFVIDKTLAHAILRPDSFTEICTSEYDENKGRVDISFSNKVPYSVITQSLVKRLALILYDNYWNASWSQVCNIKKERGEEDWPFCRVECPPPVFSDCSWNVRAIQNERNIFVLEIVGVTPNKPFPFEEIRYTHPRSHDGHEASPSSSVKIPKSKPKNERILSINQDGLSAKNITNPQTNRFKASFFDYSNDIVITEITLGSILSQDEGDPEIEMPDNESAEPEITEAVSIRSTSVVSEDDHSTGMDEQTSSRSEVQQVSFDDESGFGEIKAAEFVPIENTRQIPRSFENFIDAIRVISKDQVENEADFEAHYIIRDIPENSPLSKINKEENRQYSLVRLLYPDKSRYILEIDVSDEHEISTIIFKIVSGNLWTIVEKILVEYMSASGCWDREKLNSDDSITYHLSRHRTAGLLSKRLKRHL